jgi:hypothetical protein
VIEDVEFALGRRVVTDGKLVGAGLKVRVELVLREDRLNLTNHCRPVVDTLFEHSKFVDVSFRELSNAVDLPDDTGSILSDGDLLLNHPETLKVTLGKLLVLAFFLPCK